MKNKYCPEPAPLHVAAVRCYICDALSRQREDMEKEIEFYIKEQLSKLPRRFFEDEDHAVGGYISKKDLFNLIQSLKGGDKTLEVEKEV